LNDVCNVGEIWEVCLAALPLFFEMASGHIGQVFLDVFVLGLFFDDAVI
jgi:hypothetical protein